MYLLTKLLNWWRSISNTQAAFTVSVALTLIMFMIPDCGFGDHKHECRWNSAEHYFLSLIPGVLTFLGLWLSWQYEDEAAWLHAALVLAATAATTFAVGGAGGWLTYEPLKQLINLLGYQLMLDRHAWVIGSGFVVAAIAVPMKIAEAISVKRFIRENTGQHQ